MSKYDESSRLYYGLYATYSFVINDKEINVVAKDIESAKEKIMHQVNR
jgi:hypothetical protein